MYREVLCVMDSSAGLIPPLLRLHLHFLSICLNIFSFNVMQFTKPGFTFITVIIGLSAMTGISAAALVADDLTIRVYLWVFC
jgi:hypothetical protein